jgi:hypothetical protein
MIGLLIDSGTGDLLIEGGGIVAGENTAQVAEHVLIAHMGEFKEYPLIGAGVMKMRGGTPDKLWFAETKKMLRTCGVAVSNVTMSAEGIITLE